jgi:hypothetical protein
VPPPAQGPHRRQPHIPGVVNGALAQQLLSQVRLSHTVARTSVAFDDPNLVSHAGLVMALAARAGLHNVAAEHVRPAGDCGANADLKIGCLAT